MPSSACIKLFVCTFINGLIMSFKRNPSVIVIGAGMTGILMAKKLKDAGIEKVIVLEKKEKVGGTWRENTYPGVACDIPSHMYTYSFEPNPNWSNFFARGNEIQEYFENVVDKYELRPMIRFNETVTEAKFDNGVWKVTTSTGDNYECDFVISATGILHHPSLPDIPGLDSFEGNMFHTSNWNHDVQLDATQSVGIVGTGSTAAQCIPELINSGAKVNVFQRTPQWILPLKDFSIPNFVKRLLGRFPTLNRISRASGKFFVEHFFTKAVTGHKIQRFLMEFFVKLNLKLAIKDPELRRKLRPDYQVGCKRLIINTTFYKAIQKDNAALITEGIDHIEPKGVVTKDGKLHELDTLVLSTGFDPLAYMRPMNLIGKDNTHINDAWAENVGVYRSMLIPKFPNFFLTLGPNTPIGNFSVIAMSEVQCDYLLKLISQWRSGKFDAVEPTNIAVENFNAYVKNGLDATAWVGGCTSWYLDAHGNPILWPYTWGRWVKEMRIPNDEDLQFASYSQQ